MTIVDPSEPVGFPIIQAARVDASLLFTAPSVFNFHDQELLQ
ncbi:hypothetical protein DM47_2217 [Burkholderia mallei]|nr:hypothetical protein X990_5276 [Burkholderia pseudomallei MSHR4868]KOS92287.1 hypothetical protein DM49_2954 [Burkholderia mallei]KOT18000.1 hypothetical protein DM47_2217 [Burkholderia mallei]KOT20500.1 hypothetical protein DM52_1600 [Burkholderia mallei]